jgi:hypothetical protein
MSRPASVLPTPGARRPRAWRAAVVRPLTVTLGATLLAGLLSPKVARAEDQGLQPASVVHFTSKGREQDVRLTIGSEESPAAACRTPCTLRMPAGRYDLMSRGRGVRAYRGALDVPAGESHVAIRAASKGGFVTGVVFTGLGGVMTALPVAFGVAALASAPGDPYNEAAAGIGFGIAGLVGLPMLITGLVLLVTSPERGYEIASRAEANP